MSNNDDKKNESQNGNSNVNSANTNNNQTVNIETKQKGFDGRLDNAKDTKIDLSQIQRPPQPTNIVKNNISKIEIKGTKNK